VRNVVLTTFTVTLCYLLRFATITVKAIALHEPQVGCGAGTGPGSEGEEITRMCVRGAGDE
jgi:hypothetical protein